MPTLSETSSNSSNVDKIGKEKTKTKVFEKPIQSETNGSLTSRSNVQQARVAPKSCNKNLPSSFMGPNVSEVDEGFFQKASFFDFILIYSDFTKLWSSI